MISPHHSHPTNGVRPADSIANEFLSDPVEISVSPGKPTVDEISQHAIFSRNSEKDQKLIKLLRNRQSWKKVVVFTKMRHGADKVNRKLLRAGISSAAIHSDKTQNQRTREGRLKGSGAGISACLSRPT